MGNTRIRPERYGSDSQRGRAGCEIRLLSRATTANRIATPVRLRAATSNRAINSSGSMGDPDCPVAAVAGAGATSQ
ncbi:hypothetical protein [Streptomyces sp. NPDC058964]|uniref:hypothetical protein n=1 Tax=Streptomyces sp. NPDC058964 TaxID=3346681 RepID=UPI0036925916